MKFLLIILLIAVVFCADADYLPTPGGVYVHKDCVHNVPSGSKIETKDSGITFVTLPKDNKVIQIPKCEHPTRKVQKQSPLNNVGGYWYGWQLWTTFKNPSGETFDAFTGTMSVPQNPASFWGGIVYLFPGLQNYDWIPTEDGPNPPSGFDIIQPVLQYGSTPAGGGDYWALASWYVTVDSGYIVSDLIRVNAMDVIQCNMTFVDKSNDEWFINGYVQESDQTNIHVSKARLNTQPWAYLALEMYNIDGCDNYPTSDVIFTQNVLKAQGKTITPTWEAHTQYQNPQCNEKVVINGPDNVHFVFAQN
ncbi:hypothetical protein M0812_27804 [Anaeramoeba flamelloides]|uniref:Uncharacterized protein n=1 Tax=Anaeramoeba flamelloides TaxID=1746091 RepID=A0AAV7Y9Y0_9EUKA|nr:hypothetical protein M0812_27804 [Anaeramoeba flamelloides]